MVVVVVSVVLGGHERYYHACLLASTEVARGLSSVQGWAEGWTPGICTMKPHDVHAQHPFCPSSLWQTPT